MVADVLDPTTGDLADVDEPTLVLVLFEVDEDPEVLNLVDFTDDEFASVGPATVFHRDAIVSTTSPLISALPPVGVASL